MIRLIAATLLLCTIVSAGDRVPVIVELFTSEGCSSCPPADDLLADLERRQPIANADLIVLSEHVDYWNSLGWQDPFSAPVFTQRQQSYAAMLRSTDVFTPQTVIDGHFATVGSRRTDILKAIKASAQSAKPDLQITVSREGDTVIIGVPATTRGNVWVALTEASVVSRVKHGENVGKTLQHVGVVRSLKKLSGNQTRIIVDKSWRSDLRVVAFVQDGESGKILQAVQKQL
jgi:hypothetical protein